MRLPCRRLPLLEQGANSMGARGKRERAEPRSKHIKLAVGYGGRSWRIVAVAGQAGDRASIPPPPPPPPPPSEVQAAAAEAEGAAR